MAAACVILSACNADNPNDDPNAVAADPLEMQVDAGAPNLTTHTTDSAVTVESGSSLKLSGTASDDRGVVRVTWTTAQGGAGVVPVEDR